jgi:hypothetical protein
MKILVNISILFSCVTVLWFLTENRRIYAILSLIFFPMVIKVFGKDALSVSTVLIYIFSINYFVRTKTNFFYWMKYKTKVNIDIIAPLIIILIIVGAVSTFSVPSTLFFKALRKYSDFSSSLLLFAYIYYQYTNYKNHNELFYFIDKFFRVYIIMITTQVVISFLIWKIPFLKSFFSYFTFSNVEEISAFTEDLPIARLRSLIYSYEAYAESLAVICPIVLYQFFHKKNSLWFLVHAILFLGIIYTRTRSGIMLYIFGTIIYMFYNLSRISLKNSIIILYGIMALIFSIILFSDIYTDAFIRFNESIQLYESGKYLEAMNRPKFFDNFTYVVNNMGYWGNGLISIHEYTGGTHLHSLYLTIMFQFGLFGSIFYFCLLFIILYKLVKTFFLSYKTEYRMLTFSMLLSYLIFLTNEMKYEFNRHEAYQQIIWALFASFMCISHYIDEVIKASYAFSTFHHKYRARAKTFKMS